MSKREIYLQGRCREKPRPHGGWPVFLKSEAGGLVRLKFQRRLGPTPRLNCRCDRRKIRALRNEGIVGQSQCIRCSLKIQEFRFHPENIHNYDIEHIILLIR